jgi:hypothetical protein
MTLPIASQRSPSSKREGIESGRSVVAATLQQPSEPKRIEAYPSKSTNRSQPSQKFNEATILEEYWQSRDKNPCCNHIVIPTSTAEIGAKKDESHIAIAFISLRFAKPHRIHLTHSQRSGKNQTLSSFSALSMTLCGGAKTKLKTAPSLHFLVVVLLQFYDPSRNQNPMLALSSP